MFIIHGIAYTSTVLVHVRNKNKAQVKTHDTPRSTIDNQKMRSTRIRCHKSKCMKRRRIEGDYASDVDRKFPRSNHQKQLINCIRHMS